MPILTTLIALPFLGAVLLLLLPEAVRNACRWLTVLLCTVHLALSSWLWFQFDPQLVGYQFAENHDWITMALGQFGIISIDYSVGTDGLSLPMVWLTSLVMLVGAVSSFEIREKERAYYALYLLLMGSVVGCFVALDLFLFFLFFEFMLLPMYFLIGIWGGPRREYASLKFFIYTLAGSVFILLVMIGLYLSVIDPVETALNIGLVQDRAQITEDVLAEVQSLVSQLQIDPAQLVHTFEIPYLTNPRNFVPESLLSTMAGHEIFGLSARLLAFLMLFIGFAVKLPMVPLHTWLPDAHVEAPTPISVVLAGILLKIGGYGFFRIAYEIFPDGAIYFADWIAGLGVLSIVYGAFNALSQKDLKRLIAYSSVSHMGFVLLGLAALTPEGANAAIYQLFSHGILSPMLFLVVGVVYARTHDRNIDHYQGLASTMPAYTGLTAIAFFASLGLPGFSGFIGEFFSLMGAFNSLYIPVWMVVAGGFGLILGAGYFLWTFQRVFLGKRWSTHDAQLLTDLNAREKLMLVPLALLSLFFGILPGTVFAITEGYVLEFMKHF
ncbi:oxidoreductase [Siphonobacter sp. BAB-5385]|uniref:complex I subunit 4 family protein n=1 Tax=unclassified Siphonobacter TaxID=2635712 RepID=UPI000B9E5B32|nr:MULTISPECIES: NADH-quinone oxidoreductase subunit M [unclassified Siphonobacter]OZI06666.1 oxidoreductase [Siphonobacter sp. BAB-5385]PMD96439.1 oxidoreductase [Siphonobacter sp. BAB-5405]